MRTTPAHEEYKHKNAVYKKEMGKRAAEIEQQQSAVTSMVQSVGWKLIEKWLDSEKKYLLNRMQKELRDGDADKAQLTAFEIEGTNKVFKKIINFIGK